MFLEGRVPLPELADPLLGAMGRVLEDRDGESVLGRFGFCCAVAEIKMGLVRLKKHLFYIQGKGREKEMDKSNWEFQF